MSQLISQPRSSSPQPSQPIQLPPFCSICGHYGCPSPGQQGGQHLISLCGSYLCCIN